MRRGRAARGPAIVLLGERQLVPPGKKAQQLAPRKEQVESRCVVMASFVVVRSPHLGEVRRQDKVRRGIRVVVECLAERLADRKTTGELLDTEDQLSTQLLKVCIGSSSSGRHVDQGRTTKILCTFKKESIDRQNPKYLIRLLWWDCIKPKVKVLKVCRDPLCRGA